MTLVSLLALAIGFFLFPEFAEASMGEEVVSFIKEFWFLILIVPLTLGLKRIFDGTST